MLVTGLRGMGKTTMLRRLADEIDDDPALGKQWVPLLFREEQYNLYSLAHLYQNLLSALESSLLRQAWDRAEIAHLEGAARRVRAEAPAAQIQSIPVLLAEWTKAHNRRLVVLFDNFDLVIERLGDNAAELVKLFTKTPWLELIAASADQPLAWPETQPSLKAIFPGAQQIRLDGLTHEQSEQLFRALASDRGHTRITQMLETDPGRLRAIHEMAAGNIRTLVILYDVMASDKSGAVENELAAVLEDHTPLYKHRVDALPKQAQAIFDALARNWDPMTVAMVADQTGIPGNIISSQLEKLYDGGLLHKQNISTLMKRQPTGWKSGSSISGI